MMRKRMVCILLITLCFVLLGCSGSKSTTLYDEETEMEILNKVTTASNFDMEGNVYLKDARFQNAREEVKDDNVFLFATKEEADKAVADGKIGEKDIFAYPTETTQLRLDRLNGFIESKELKDDLAEFGLEYPITVNDLSKIQKLYMN